MRGVGKGATSSFYKIVEEKDGYQIRSFYFMFFVLSNKVLDSLLYKHCIYRNPADVNHEKPFDLTPKVSSLHFLQK